MEVKIWYVESIQFLTKYISALKASHDRELKFFRYVVKNWYIKSNANFAALFQFPYCLEPTELDMLLSWYFVGINPNKPPTNSLTLLANISLIPNNKFSRHNCSLLL